MVSGIIKGIYNSEVIHLLGIWDKKEKCFVDDKTGWDLFIWQDGKVYELEAANMHGDAWLEKVDVSDRYEPRPR